MSETTKTPNYNLLKPNVGADDDLWGGHWNQNADTLDSLIKTVENKAGVVSFNGRANVVSLTNTDVVTVLPGSVTAPLMNGTASAGVATTWSKSDHQHPTDTTRAAASAVPSPSATAPTMNSVADAGVAVAYSRGDHTHPVDTSRYAASNPSGYQTAAQVTTALLPYAPLASPVFTGNPIAPTPAPGDADTSVATTAFVAGAVALAFNDVGRNYIHNPLFAVAQRVGPWTGPGYTLDRWRLDTAVDVTNVNSVALGDAERAAIGDEAATQGMSVSVTGNASAGAYTRISQFIEGVRRLTGKTVTVSFWAYATAGTPKIGVAAVQSFGTGGSHAGVNQINGTPVTISTTPSRYSVVFTYPSASGKALGTNKDDYSSLVLHFSAGANSAVFAGGIGVQSGNFALWGVQLEVGSVATPLEKPDPRYDLSNCQRFYQVGAAGTIGYSTAGNAVGVFASFPVTMHHTPTVTPTGTLQSVNAASVNVDTPLTSGFRLFYTSAATGTVQGTNTYTASADL